MKNFLFFYFKKKTQFFLSANLLQRGKIFFIYVSMRVIFKRGINIQIFYRKILYIFKRLKIGGARSMAPIPQPIKRFNDILSVPTAKSWNSKPRDPSNRGCIEDAFCYKSISESVFRDTRGFPEIEPRRVLNDRKFRDPVPFP